MIEFTGIKQQLLDRLQQFMHAIEAYVPTLLSELAWLIAGFVFAWTARWLIIRLGKGIDRLAQAVGVASLNVSLKWPLANILGWLVFWIIILYFFTAAVESLGLPALAEILGKFIHSLPSLLVAAAFVVGGVLLGNSLRDRIINSARGAGLRQADVMGNWVRMIIIILAFIAGLAQIGLDVRLFELMLTIFAAAVAGAVALAFGLGAGSTVSNIISARYVRKNYRIGQNIQIQKFEGRILELLPNGVILDTDAGRVFIPARIFDQEASVLLDNQPVDDH
jgi:small-conductance mechanosensitive channel